MLRANDIVEAYREWIKGDIKESPRQHYDLGKFFFTVTIGTVGAVAAIKKDFRGLTLSTSFIFFLGLMFIALVIALLMVVPRERTLNSTTDLRSEHAKQVRRVIDMSVGWFATWLIGTGFGIAALFH